MKLTLILISGCKLDIEKEYELIGYKIKKNNNKERANEIKIFLLETKVKDFIDFFKECYCFEIRKDRKKGKIYLCSSLSNITFSCFEN